MARRIVGLMIAVLGAAVAVASVDDRRLAWTAFWAFVVLGLGLLVLEQIADNARDKREQGRDEAIAVLKSKSTSQQLALSDMRKSLTAISRRDAERDQSLRSQILLLAMDLEGFVAERLAEAPEIDAEAAGTKKHADYVQSVMNEHKWQNDSGMLYQSRYVDRVRLLVNELARIGVADDMLIAEGNRQFPYSIGTAQAVAQYLRAAADRMP